MAMQCMTVKAILVAGGYGSRLLPFTRYTQKTLLPLHERPVIDYALGTIRRAGIKDITIISNQFVGQIAKHVGRACRENAFTTSSRKSRWALPTPSTWLAPTTPMRA